MRKLLLTLYAIITIAEIFAQVPEKMSYQAVVRNGSGQIIPNQKVGIKVSILQDSELGIAVYSETHAPTTNSMGLVTIEIGNGTVVSGIFGTVNWSSGNYFIKTEIDPAGGTNYTLMGTNKLLSVPYALYAKNAGQYSEIDPVFKNSFDFSNAAPNDLLQFNGTKWVKFTPNYLTSISIPNQTAGDLMYFNGTSWIRIPKGFDGQILTLQAGIPVWVTSSATVNLQAPTVTLQPATNVLANTVTLNGIINPNGFYTSSYFELGEDTNYGNSIQSEPITGNVNTNINLDISVLANTTYHYRLVASNAVGKTQTNDLTFTTPCGVPNVIATGITDVTVNNATLNGTVNANGLITATSFEYGTTSSYGNSIIANPSSVSGNYETSIFSEITGLAGGTTYHYRVKATNALGTAYSNDISFTTLGNLPTATTSAATNITPKAANLNGTVNANLISTSVLFEYGLTPSYGSSSPANESPVEGDETTNVEVRVEGLSANTVYHYRVVAINSKGTTYGDDLTFTTSESFMIGDAYQGGIIFYLTGTYPNQHGLVCAPTDQSDGIRWYNGSEVATEATETAVGKGQINTNKIVAMYGSGSYAAKLCDDLVLNGYNDWFLPSKDELGLMYTNLYLNDKGNFTRGTYWSSSEIVNLLFEMYEAWYHVFNTGSQNHGPTYNINCVRAVRVF